MEPFALTIFGVTSNLAQIKLLPSLYDLEEKNLLPPETEILGIARRDFRNSSLREFVASALHADNHHHRHPIVPEIEKKLLSRFHYLQGDFATDPSVYRKIQERNTLPNRLYYLATYPHLYSHIFRSLDEFGLNKHPQGWVRLIIEKPLGTNLKTAQELDKLLHRFFSEEQIYRLDHYLGKETLQNILTFRFGNGIFRPLMNSTYVDHLQITALEEFGIGNRGGYYDKVGALKDVGQNHQLQMISVSTMDEPEAFTNAAVTTQRLKILENLTPYPESLVLGQYDGYQNEENVEKDSQTDTFYAFKTEINHPLWRGVPIYVRGGKKLARTATEINVVFKIPEKRLFGHLERGMEPNYLTYRLQPNEGIGLSILTKNPTHDWSLDVDHMQYCYPLQKNSLPDAYEKLLYDVIKGDQTFFNDAPEIEAEWAFVDKLLTLSHPLHPYSPGTWGPRAADDLLASDGRHWLAPSENFCRI